MFQCCPQLTEEREVDEREVVEQQEPEEFACMQHTSSATAAYTVALLQVMLQDIPSQQVQHSSISNVLAPAYIAGMCDEADDECSRVRGVADLHLFETSTSSRQWRCTW